MTTYADYEADKKAFKTGFKCKTTKTVEGARTIKTIVRSDMAIFAEIETVFYDKKTGAPSHMSLSWKSTINPTFKACGIAMDGTTFDLA